jgi:hypothetical protein
MVFSFNNLLDSHYIHNYITTKLTGGFIYAGENSSG